MRQVMSIAWQLCSVVNVQFACVLHFQEDWGTPGICPLLTLPIEGVPFEATCPAYLWRADWRMGCDIKLNHLRLWQCQNGLYVSGQAVILASLKDRNAKLILDAPAQAVSCHTGKTTFIRELVIQLIAKWTPPPPYPLSPLTFLTCAN